MAETQTHYVYYPGHLGKNPVTDLGGDRGIRWDRQVKKVPLAAARYLVAEGGFHRALDLEEAATILGRTKKKLRELVAAGNLKAATYKPPREGDPEVLVIVLPAGVNAGALKRTLDRQPDPAPADDATEV